MERSKFWAFLFSFVPGAGEMYLGLKRRGTEIMFMFLSVFCITVFFGLGVLSVFMGLIWFYSFFDVMELRRMSNEERMQLNDTFILGSENIEMRDIKDKLSKRKKDIGMVLIILGAVAILQNIMYFARDLIWSLVDENSIIGRILNMLPYNFLTTIVFAVILIWFGLKLVKADKKKDEIS